MQQNEKLEHGHFYHIYSHGVGARDLFRCEENYLHFLSLYDKYIEPVAETYAWVLMKNHFHLVIRIKEKKDIPLVIKPTPDRVLNPVRGKYDEPKPQKIGTPSQQFSKLFNSYAQAYNKWNESCGALFERPFKRKRIDSLQYLKQVIIYVHRNPVHHGFCEHPIEYPWSSYLTCTSDKITKLKRDEVLKWFGNKKNFEEWHKNKINMDRMEWEMGL